MCTSEEQPLQLAHRLAREKLSGMDMKEQFLRSGVQYVGPDRVSIEYLNRSYVMTIPSMEISLKDDIAHCEQIDLTDRILILHYLITARGTPPSGKLIGFKQLPGGYFEHGSVSREVITPLLERFGKEPERLAEAAGKLAGSRLSYGDVAVSIKAFPRISVVIVLRRGDDEFPPNASLLFDSTVSDYLSTEDISVLCERIVEKLTHCGQNGG